MNCFVVKLYVLLVASMVETALFLELSPGLLCSIFYLLCFRAVLKKLPIMFNIMSINTAVMPQFIYNYVSIVKLQTIML